MHYRCGIDAHNSTVGPSCRALVLLLIFLLSSLLLYLLVVKILFTMPVMVLLVVMSPLARKDAAPTPTAGRRLCAQVGTDEQHVDHCRGRGFTTFGLPGTSFACSAVRRLPQEGCNPRGLSR